MKGRSHALPGALVRRWVLTLAALAWAGCGPPPVREIPELDLAGMEPQIVRRLEHAREEVVAAPGSAARWGRLGRVLDAHALYDAATGCYLAAAELDSEDYRWPYLAALASRRTDLEAALSLFERAEGLGPPEAAFFVNLGDARLEAGDLDRALAAYRGAAERDPRSSHALYGLAQVEVARGELEAARRRLQEAAELAPYHGEVHALLSQVHARLGDAEAATLESWRARAYPEATAVPDPVYGAVLTQAVSSRALSRRGRSLAARGRYEEAEALFRRVLAIRDPGDARDHANLGAAIAGQGRHQEAIAHFERALELHPDEAYAHHNLGLSLAALRRWNEAEEHAGAAVQIDPAYAEAHHGLGLLAASRGRDEAAVRSFRRAVEINPGHGGARNNLAKSLAALGRMEEAIEEWRLSVAVDPLGVESLYNLGVALSRAGAHEEAVGTLERGLERAPNSSLMARALAWELATAADDGVRDGRRAEELARRVISQYPDDPRVADLWAAVLAERGRFEEAASAAARAVAAARALGERELALQIEERLRGYTVERPYRRGGG